MRRTSRRSCSIPSRSRRRRCHRDHPIEHRFEDVAKAAQLGTQPAVRDVSGEQHRSRLLQQRLAEQFGGAVGIGILFVWAAGCALLKVYGEAAGGVGSLALIAFCIALGTPVPDLHALELRTLLFAAGGLWAAGLALALWPVHPYRPVRRAVAACHRALADHARRLAKGGPGWFDAASKERGAIRALLENARAGIALVRAERSGDSRRAELLTALYESAELSLGDLSALAETLQSREDRGAPKPETLQPLLETVSRAFDSVAQAPGEEPASLEQPETRLPEDAEIAPPL